MAAARVDDEEQDTFRLDLVRCFFFFSVCVRTDGGGLDCGVSRLASL